MAIIFFGTPSFAVPSLETLIAHGEEIVEVVTQPDRVGGRGHKILPSPVKVVAEHLRLRVLQPEKINSSEFIHHVIDLRPEFLVVVAYGKILSKDLLQIPQRGCINVHASLLPKYRGASPIQWAIINGEKRTGITTMLMDEGLDTGDILLQSGVDIMKGDNSKSLSGRLSRIGADFLVETLRGLRDGIISPVLQKGEPSYAPPIKKEDGLIDWSMPAKAIFNRVRGLYPWPSAYSYFRSKRVKILKVEVLKGDGRSGEVIHKDKKSLIIGTSDGTVSLLEVQVEGKRQMEIADFLQGQGRDIKAGERFG